jgi:hypothetical protein
MYINADFQILDLKLGNKLQFKRDLEQNTLGSNANLCKYVDIVQ